VGCILILKQDIIYTREARCVPAKACGKTKALVRQNFYFAGSLFHFKHLAQLLRNQSTSIRMDGGTNTNPGLDEGRCLGFLLFSFFFDLKSSDLLMVLALSLGAQFRLFL